MELKFVNGSVIQSLENQSETCRSSKAYKFDDTYITFSMKGNYTDEDHNFYSTDVLYKAWKDYIGKEIECENNVRRIVTAVNIQDDFIFIDTVKIDTN